MQQAPSGNHDVMCFPPVYRSFRIEYDGYEAARTTYHDYIAPKSGFIREAFLFWLMPPILCAAGPELGLAISPQIGRKSLGHTGPLVGAGWGTGGIRNAIGILSTDPRDTSPIFNIWVHGRQSKIAIWRKWPILVPLSHFLDDHAT